MKDRIEKQDTYHEGRRKGTWLSFSLRQTPETISMSPITVTTHDLIGAVIPE